MTIRRFNYTERRRISRSDARISLVSQGDATAFDADLHLSGYDLPASANVIIEAYKSPILMRFDLGTIGSARRPASTLLSEFEPPEGVKFRVKVVTDETSTGRLLAVADQI